MFVKTVTRDQAPAVTKIRQHGLFNDTMLRAHVAGILTKGQ